MSSIPSLQSLTEAATISGDTCKSIFDATLKATQDLFALNGEYFRSLTEGSATPGAGSNFQEQISAQSQRFERTGAYLRDVNDVCLKTQAEIIRLNTECAGEVGKALVAQFDAVFQAAPIDGGKVADMFKSAWTSAGAAYEKVMDVSRQITESTFTATTEALQQAANAPSAGGGTSRRTA